MKKVLIPATLGKLADGARAILRERGYEAVELGEITSDDIDCGLSHIDNDVCFPAIAAIGQYIRYFNEHGTNDIACVLAAEICAGCRSASVPYVLHGALERAGFTNVEIVFFSSAESKSSAPPEEPVNLDGRKPVVGVCGNTPTLTTYELRRAVVRHIEKSGCQVVMPPLQRVCDERDFLSPAFEYFNDLGVTSVICILPFGCLGGHVYARGQLRKMQERFPGIELTILDYDPSASEVNLENRTELVVQTAREWFASRTS